MGLIVLILGGLLLLGQDKHTFPFLLYINSIYLNKVLEYDFDVFFKLLFLILLVFYGCKYGFKIKSFGVPIFVLVLFAVNYMFADFGGTYSPVDFITAFIPLFTGFLYHTVSFSETQKRHIIKCLVYLPLFSVVAGIFLWPFGITNPFQRGAYIGLSGASEATNLAFFCVISMASCLYLFLKTQIIKYRYLMYLNYLFLLCSLTRGGILSGTFFIIYDLIPFLKSILKKRSRFLLFFMIAILAIIPLRFVALQLISRTYTTNGQINSSGRLEAWQIIIGLCRNKLWGNGYGFLKTITDPRLKAFTAAHNEYIHLITEMGYIGLICFILAMLVVMKKRIKDINSVKPVITLLMMSFAMYSVFDNTITNYCFWFPFMLFLACSNILEINDTHFNKYLMKQSWKIKTRK